MICYISIGFSMFNKLITKITWYMDKIINCKFIVTKQILKKLLKYQKLIKKFKIKSCFSLSLIIIIVIFIIFMFIIKIISSLFMMLRKIQWKIYQKNKLHFKIINNYKKIIKMVQKNKQ